MTRPSFDAYHLWFAGALFAGAIAASAVYGLIGTLVRTWPEPFTSDRDR